MIRPILFFGISLAFMLLGSPCPFLQKCQLLVEIASPSPTQRSALGPGSGELSLPNVSKLSLAELGKTNNICL